MLRDAYLSFVLDFDTPEEQEDSEEILDSLIALMCRLNKQYLRRNGDRVPCLYSSGVKYSPPDQTKPKPPVQKMRELVSLLKTMTDTEAGEMVVRIIRGIESFADIPTLYDRGDGDCNELVPVRVAELWRAGIVARPWLQKDRNERTGGWTYHVVVQWPDGSSEDPSLILGMGGPARAADRAEEIRKNKERWDAHMAAAQHLIQAEGAHPLAVAKQIDLMGLVPSDGVFRSPFRGSDA